MPIEFQNKKAIFSDIVTVDEAETLLEWLQQNPDAVIDLSCLSHMHTACLQVLMAADPDFSSWPEDESLMRWLRSAFKK